MSAAVAFAFGAGLLATVNPCGFAMLPSFLAFYLGGSETDVESRPLLARAAQGFVVGAVLSAAFGGVFIFAGLIVSAGLRSFLDVVPWVAVLIGVGLTVLGLAMLAGRHVGLMAATRVRVDGRQRQGYRRVAIFGATYALASLSCTLAVFLVVVGQALAVANPVQLLAVFGAYAAGSAAVLIGLSMSAALAKGALARGLRRLLPVVNRGAGALLAASGLYLVLYWLPAVTAGDQTSDSWAARTTRGLSSTLASFFSANTDVFALVLAGLVATGGLLLVNARREGRPSVVLGDDCCTPTEATPEPRPELPLEAVQRS